MLEWSLLAHIFLFLCLVCIHVFPCSPASSPSRDRAAVIILLSRQDRVCLEACHCGIDRQGLRAEISPRLVYHFGLYLPMQPFRPSTYVLFRVGAEGEITRIRKICQRCVLERYQRYLNYHHALMLSCTDGIYERWVHAGTVLGRFLCRLELKGSFFASYTSTTISPLLSMSSRRKHGESKILREREKKAKIPRAEGSQKSGRLIDWAALPIQRLRREHTRPIPSCRFVWVGGVTLITHRFLARDNSFQFAAILFSRALPWLASRRRRSLDRIVLDRGRPAVVTPPICRECTHPGSTEGCLDRYISFATSLSGSLISIWGEFSLVVSALPAPSFLLFFFFSFFLLRSCLLLPFCCPNIFYLLSLFRSDASCLILRMQSADLVSQWFV